MPMWREGEVVNARVVELPVARHWGRRSWGTVVAAAVVGRASSLLLRGIVKDMLMVVGTAEGAATSCVISAIAVPSRAPLVVCQLTVAQCPVDLMVSELVGQSELEKCRRRVESSEPQGGPCMWTIDRGNANALDNLTI